MTVEKKKTTRKSTGKTVAKASIKEVVDSHEVVHEKVDIKTILPNGYFPKFSKFGLHDGYITLPSRIMRFILDNPSNWYATYNDYQYFGDEDFFLTLVYYIVNEGSINIQNIQSGEFYKLSVNDDETKK